MTWETDEAWDEVVARGPDPAKARRFRGKILLEVRCKPAGHVLAYVYPTRHGALLVPTVSGLPINKPTPGSVVRRNQASLQAVLGAKAIRPADIEQSGRDAWRETFEEDDYGTQRVFIRGTSLVGAIETERRRKHRQDFPVEGLEEVDYTRMAHFLLCRCGQRYLYSSDLDQALDANARSVTA